MNMEKILLVGTGRMARAYMPVLVALGKEVVVVGRSEEGCASFGKETGVEVRAGGLARYQGEVPRTAIIAVDVPELAAVATEAIQAGSRAILLEKPGALSREELTHLIGVADAVGASVRIAYNRRYYASVLAAKERIASAGGVRSFTLEFNERPTAKGAIRKLNVDKRTEDNWFIANSTHVVDLAFFLGGAPRALEGFAATGPLWDPHPSFFSGAGITTGDAPFSYRANWELPGPWEVVLGTMQGNFVLRPLESLSLEKGGVLTPISLDDELERKFKPGFYRQVDAFLKGESILPTLHEQLETFSWYETMLRQRYFPLS